jgi:hypothetical protein
VAKDEYASVNALGSYYDVHGEGNHFGAWSRS